MLLLDVELTLVLNWLICVWAAYHWMCGVDVNAWLNETEDSHKCINDTYVCD